MAAPLPHDGDDNPVTSVYVDGYGPAPLLGGTLQTLGDGTKAAPAQVTGIVSGGGGGGGGGGAITASDGAITTIGSTTDSASTSGSSAGTLVALLKGILTQLLGTLRVTVGNFPSTLSLFQFDGSGNLKTTGTSGGGGVVTSTDGGLTTVGTTTDTTYTSGAGTLVAILKGIFGRLGSTLSVNGSVSVTNLPTTQPVSGTITETNSSSINTHAASIDTATSASKTDLDSIVTQTTTTATQTTSLNTVHGAKSDGAATDTTSAWSAIALFKAILAKLGLFQFDGSGNLKVTGGGGGGGGGLSTNDGTFAKETGGNLATLVSQTVGLATQTTLASILSALQGILNFNFPDISTTGTLTIAQPTIGTPVTGASVVLAVGKGQSSWKATLTGANFTSNSVIVVDHSSDGGITYFSSAFKVVGSLQTTVVQSATGPAPLELSGNDAGVSHIKIRCMTLGSGDSISVALRAGSGISSLGLLSSIPSGNNPVGGMYLNDGTTSTQKATVDNSGNLHVSATSDGTFAKESGGNLAAVSASLGTTTDSPASSGTGGTWSVPALLRGILNFFASDANGNLLVNNQAPIYYSTSGGPATASGIPSGYGSDRAKDLQGKGLDATASGGITTTVVGDSQVTFTTPPLTFAGGTLQLSGGSNPIEEVYATDSFVPSTSTTSVSLKTSVRYAGHTTATWSKFSSQGPLGNSFTADGVGISANAIVDPTSTVPGAYRVPSAATQDAAPPASIQEVATGFFNGTTVDRVSSSKPLPTSDANTASINTHAANVDTATGTQADTAYTTGSGTIVALLKGLFAKLGLLQFDGSGNLKVTGGGGGGGGAVTSVDGGLVTVGTTTDTAYTTGSGSLVALLKGIFTKLANTLTVSGSVSVTNLPTTQAISVADGSNITQGTTTDTAYTTGSGSLVALLKGIFTKLAGTLTVSVSNLPATQPVSGSVSVSNLPTSQAVTSIDGGQASIGTTTDTAYTTGSGSVIALLKGLFTKLAQFTFDGSGNLKITGGTGGSGGAVTATDGALVTEGTTTDAAYTGGSSGSLVALLKGIYTKVAGTLTVGAHAIYAQSGTAFYQASSAIVASADSGAVSVGQYKELLFGFSITAVSGTSPSITFNVDIQGPDGVWYTAIYASSAITGVSAFTKTIGVGATVNNGFGNNVRIRWILGGSASPSVTCSMWIVGK